MMNQDDRQPLQPLQIDHIDWLIDSPSNRAEFDSKQNTASKQDRKINRWVCACREIPWARQLRTDPPKNKRRYLICRHTHHTFFWILTDWQCQRLPADALGNGPEKPMDEWNAHFRITFIHTSIGSGTYWNEWKYIYEQGSCSRSQSEKYEPPIIREREKKRRRHITLCTLSIIWVRVI